MKKIVMVILILFIICGCSNKEENKKTEYIAMKKDLLSANNSFIEEELPLDIKINVDRVNEELYSYKVIFTNPDYNMYDIEAMIVHNYHNEDLFPTIGLFNEKGELLKDSKEIIEFSDTIETNKNLNSINLELKIYIKYITEDGETKEIYYKTT